MKQLTLLFYSLLAAVAVAGDAHAAAQNERPEPARGAPKQPPDQRLGSLLLPQVHFQDATIDGALDYFRRTAERQSGGMLKLVFVQELPKDFRARHELTLELKEIPFRVALDYLGELAGVRFAIEGATVRVKAEAAAAPPVSLLHSAPSPAEAPPQMKGLSGLLGEPAEATVAGDNVHPHDGRADPGGKIGPCAPAIDGRMVHDAGSGQPDS